MLAMVSHWDAQKRDELGKGWDLTKRRCSDKLNVAFWCSGAGNGADFAI